MDMDTLSIATWNVNSLRVRLPQLAEWSAATTPDIIALQETKTTDADFPSADLTTLGYHSAYAGQRTYNGVAVLSRQPITVLATELPGFPDEQRRVLAVETAGLTVLDLYVPNGQALGSDKFAYKLGWLGNDLYLEVHIDNESKRKAARSVIPESVANADGLTMDWQAVERAVKENTGLPQLVGSRRSSADRLHLDMIF